MAAALGPTASAASTPAVCSASSITPALRRELERRDRPRTTEPLPQVARDREKHEARHPNDGQQNIFE